MCRVEHGTIRKGQAIAWCRSDGSVQSARVGTLTVTEALEQVDVDVAGPGELIGVSGIEDVTIGDTLADPRRSPAVPHHHRRRAHVVDDDRRRTPRPSPDRRATKLTARLIKSRLDAELIGNVSIRVLSDRSARFAWEVQGRGELQLAVLVETMRREGFELTIGKPEVLTQEIDGTLHEPTERLTIDVPEEHVGAVTQLLGARKATMENMTNHGTGWVRLDYVVPARALIGFRTEFLTETRGTGMLHHVFEGWTPWAGEIRTRDRGSVVADRTGQTTGYAIQALQERTALYVAPGEQVYEGMVVGENSRNEDMDVNICREKAKTNIPHPVVGRHDPSHPAEGLLPRAGARVDRRRRVCRGDARDGAYPQDRARRGRAGAHPEEAEEPSGLIPRARPAPDVTAGREGVAT